MTKDSFTAGIFLSSICFFPLEPSAQVQSQIIDTFTGASAAHSWKVFDGACLTAGNNTGSIPACVGLSYYTVRNSVLVGGAEGNMPDTPGYGALRLTNGDTKPNGINSLGQTGAILSNTPINANSGIKIRFTATTYGGNDFSTTGGDGIVFFLLDAGDGKKPQPTKLGVFGGSLGYACVSNPARTDSDGIENGYIGLGFDEYGNFTNYNETGNTGPGWSPNTISLRGAGNVNWNFLNKTYPSLYPSSLTINERDVAVNVTCAKGKLYNASGSDQIINGEIIKSGTHSLTLGIQNYAMLFYNRLPPAVTLQNQQGVPTPKRSAALPVSYDLTITKNGLLTLAYSINGGGYITAVSKQPINLSNGIPPDYYWVGFAASSGSGTNIHEIGCFRQSSAAASIDSASVNTQQNQVLEAGTQVYLANYQVDNWWGQLFARPLLYSSITDTVTIGSTPNWDANCVLTGGKCPSTGIISPAQESRNILTRVGARAVPFQWNKLSISHHAMLDNDQRGLDYLRGDRSNEIGNAGNFFRTRTGILGDIMNSGPVWVGPPSAPYSGPWIDKLSNKAGPEGSSYQKFSATYATRTHVVYTGANDGMLHGFRSGAYDATGKFSTAVSPNDGRELIAYIPTKALETLYSPNGTVSFPDPRYAHVPYVDVTPGTGDLYYQGAWHTWIVGGLGGGGNIGGPINDKTSTGVGNLFAIDVTDPSLFSEANASSLVLGDWTSSNISCVSNIPSNCGQNLGNIYGTPIIRRLHDGNWAVIFGNGFHSASGTAGIFIMTVNQNTGLKSFRFLDTGYGAPNDPTGTSSKNGIAYVSSADLDNDHVTDYVYAGDLFGNVWRFDLTSSSPASWAAGSTPLFSTTAGQPISTALSVSSVPQKNGNPRILINFGTGQQLPQTATSMAVYAGGTQALYGIWDWNLQDWNAKKQTQYSSLPQPQSITINSLQNQKATDINAPSGSSSSYRTVNASPVMWPEGSKVGPNTQFGWKLDLPKSKEQVLFNPKNAYGLFIVNTYIPGTSDILTCTSEAATGYTMAITPDGGAAPTRSFFPSALGNKTTLGLAGLQLNATGSPSFVTAMKKHYMVNQTAGAVGDVIQVDPPSAKIGDRISWIKMR